jgi:hypothetical protein
MEVKNYVFLKCKLKCKTLNCNKVFTFYSFQCLILKIMQKIYFYEIRFELNN